MLTAVRQPMNFIISGTLICAGLCVLHEEVFARYSVIHGRHQPFGVGLALFGCGVVWLWFYCLGPTVLKKILERRSDAKCSSTNEGSGRRRTIKHSLTVIGLAQTADNLIPLFHWSRRGTCSSCRAVIRGRVPAAARARGPLQAAAESAAKAGRQE